MRRISEIVFTGILLFSINLSALSWTVDTTGVEGDSLQAAINLAESYPGIDTVLVADGTYHLFINDTLGLIMRDSVVLMSENGVSACTLTAVSGAGPDTAWHVIYCDSASFGDTLSHAAVIKGFTIKNGNSRLYYHGGGIYCNQASPAIDSCKITNNSATYGGGLSICAHSSPILTNNTITNNSASEGGGLYIGYLSSSILTNNTIQNNSASGGGGGLFIKFSSPTLTNNTIANNSASKGGGLYIYHYSSPILTNNTITNNSANYYGGGLYIYNYSSPILTNNTIQNNSASGGGGLFMQFSSPTLTNNTVANNSAASDGGGLLIYISAPTLTNNTIANNSAPGGGGLYVQSSSPTLTNNAIVNNSANSGGGFSINSHSSLTLRNNTIAHNLANSFGGGFYIYGYSSVDFNKCVMANNISDWGGVIYNALHSKVLVDSCFIVDNGNTGNNKSGLIYLASNADSGVTLQINHSHIYYNTFQPDTEIYNNTSVTVNLTDNFWWDTTDVDISELIYGPNDHSNWENDFISNVPGEPISVDSVRNYSDSTFSILCDSLWNPDTLYVTVYGQDRDSDIKEAAVVILKSSIYASGIAVALSETDTNSGIYEGQAYVIEQTGSDTIRQDDIYQKIKVSSLGDTIRISANVDTSKWFDILYKIQTGIEELPPSKEDELFQNTPNPFYKYTVIRYAVKEEGRVKLDVYDITGRCVANLVNNVQKPGYYTVKWDGKDSYRRTLPSGLYFYIIDTGKKRLVKKAVIMK
ncbi:right-handed parallel beta-helix repeat-containing protein [candidate division WOR-3 bacterium]|nr:right-handed parallel beta-helix repeat-containing protein [candidate division WOR-3 bacterium]